MITSRDMAELERLSESRGISTLRLMENAGSALARIIVERFKPRKVLVVCYHGNNGGDGFVCARHLAADGVKVKVAFIGSVEKLKGDALMNYERLPPQMLVHFSLEEPGRHDLLVDAILGTGARGPLREPLAAAVRAMNTSEVPIVAVDIPTGLNPDTGERSDPTIEAKLIVTLHGIKAGLVRAGLQERCVVVDIGIPIQSEGKR